jgi:hypothetical protein
MKILDGYFGLPGRGLFTGIILINLLLIWLSQTITMDETVFFNTYSEQLTFQRSMELFSVMKSLSWVAYLVSPLILIIKFSVLSLIIYTGVFFSDLQKEITLGMVFTTVIASEVIIVLASVTKLIWFTFFAGNYTLNDVSFFYPLSLINFFSQPEVAKYWVYPLQTVNLFQFCYILMLAAGLTKISSVNREKTDKIILVSYIPAVVFWITIIMFLTIDISS